MQMTTRVQFVFILSIDRVVEQETLLQLLPPPCGERYILQLRDFDPPPVERSGEHEPFIDWNGLSTALRRLLAQAEQQRANRPAEYHIAGHAPLPLFSLLGHLLQPWSGPQTVYNPADNGVWHVIPFGQGENTEPAIDATPEPARFFDVMPDSRKRSSHASGVVALCISTQGTEINARPIESILEDSLAGIEELALRTPKVFDNRSAPNIEREAKAAASVVQGLYPRAKRLAIFTVGPVQLAYVAGRAANPKYFEEIQFYYRHRDGSQELAFVVPEPSASPSIEKTPEAYTARRVVLDRMLSDFEILKDTLEPGDLPTTLSEGEREAFCRRLKSLQPERQPAGSGFWLRTLEDKLQIGEDLLEPARTLTADDQKRFLHLVLLHELLHFDQHLDRYNHHNIGSAGLVLEEVDFSADAFAIGTAATWELRCGDRRGTSRVAARTSEYILAALRGMIVFDRLEHGGKIQRLAERRLRRYLIWHLQYLRAQTLTNEQLPYELFKYRLAVELAPLSGYLDAHYEKIVRSVHSDTELCLAYGGKLRRIRKSRSFIPDLLLTAIRNTNETGAQEQLRHVLAEVSDLLAPWRHSS